ncbi:AbiH family protein [Saccharicrinis aurantiacus]|uniref:AbiH family protein n=1 Tax=Saccharicrinis aurantiacus TaxID=1849719 RepID=UPI00094F7ECA|nr:AbiH family protein [Saccharicrinis aurantiacus]
MNRLIVVGNGFDLCNGLETSYGQFIKSYLFEVVQKFTSKSHTEKELITFSLSNEKGSINYGIGDIPEGYHNKENVIELINKIIKKEEYFDHLTVEMTPFFSRIFSKLNSGWIDIEKEYFEFLTSLFKENDKIGIKELNDELNFIARKLKTYLIAEQEKYDKTKLHPRFNLAFEPDSLSVEPDEVLIVNFNYTKPKFIGEQLESLVDSKYKNIDVINLHGSLDEEIIFGFGDEEDEIFNKMLEDGNDDVILNFKMQQYASFGNYTKLERFLKKNSYQVCIVGHSCGISDRTMLKYIFEHDNCENIRIYYYVNNKEEDNYSIIYNSISRIFSSQQEMRSKVLNKTVCEDIKKIRQIAAPPELKKAHTANQVERR